jgi:hypothetical protein
MRSLRRLEAAESYLQLTQAHIPEERNIQLYRCENPKTRHIFGSKSFINIDEFYLFIYLYHVHYCEDEYETVT